MEPLSNLTVDWSVIIAVAAALFTAGQWQAARWKNQADASYLRLQAVAWTKNLLAINAHGITSMRADLAALGVLPDEEFRRKAADLARQSQRGWLREGADALIAQSPPHSACYSLLVRTRHNLKAFDDALASGRTLGAGAIVHMWATVRDLTATAETLAHLVFHLGGASHVLDDPEVTRWLHRDGGLAGDLPTPQIGASRAGQINYR